MDHSSHSAHAYHDMPMPGDGDMSPSCKMNMLLTWDYQDLCVLSSSWHIKNTTGLVLSLFAVILISMGYEYTKFWIHTWEKRQNSLSVKPVKIKRTLFYSLQVFYSFMIMLIFMSFNWWLMISVAVGAGLGHYVWGSRISGSSQSLACH